MNYAEKKRKKLNDLKIDELKKIEPKLTSEVLKIFNLKNSVNSKSLMEEHLLKTSKEWYWNIKRINDKKIYILVFISILICSCGKKGDPVYKEENQNVDKISIQVTAFSWFIEKINSQ